MKCLSGAERLRDCQPLTHPQPPAVDVQFVNWADLPTMEVRYKRDTFAINNGECIKLLIKNKFFLFLFLLLILLLFVFFAFLFF